MSIRRSSGPLDSVQYFRAIRSRSPTGIRATRRENLVFLSAKCHINRTQSPKSAKALGELFVFRCVHFLLFVFSVSARYVIRGPSRYRPDTARYSGPRRSYYYFEGAPRRSYYYFRTYYFWHAYGHLVKRPYDTLFYTYSIAYRTVHRYQADNVTCWLGNVTVSLGDVA